MTTLEIVGQIADLKESDYKTNLLLASLIELLIEKNLITKSQLMRKAQLLDLLDEIEVNAKLTKNRR